MNKLKCLHVFNTSHRPRSLSLLFIYLLFASVTRPIDESSTSFHNSVKQIKDFFFTMSLFYSATIRSFPD